MVSHNVSRILQEAQSLSNAEREELRQLLAERTVRQTDQSPQQQLRQALVERGLLSPEPPKGKSAEELRQWKPISVRGKPVSETIIEERR